jgi:hypothetical protein
MVIDPFCILVVGKVAMHERRDDRDCEDGLRDHHRGRCEQQRERSSGPERDGARYSTGPTTTGGNPKNALIKTITSRRLLKGKIASAVPTGKLVAVAPSLPG